MTAPETTTESKTTRAWLAPLLLIGVFAAALALVMSSRTFLNDQTEHDLAANFVPDAERMLAGLPPEVKFHPPLYPLVLAGMHVISGEWFRPALWLTWASAVVSLLASFDTFRRWAGLAAGWGAVLGCVCSATFVTFATWATSDAFFLALYAVAWWFAARYVDTRKPIDATGCGLVVALTVLTRTNGIALLPALLIPLLLTGRWRLRARHAAAMAAGFAALIGAWVIYAKAAGAPLSPTNNYLNLATRYFYDGRYALGGEAVRSAAEQFHGTWDVLSHDPAHMARVYGRDLVSALLIRPWSLVPWPIVLLALPGLVLLAKRMPRAVLAPLLLATIGHVLLVNFKTYEPRHHLFLVPVIGAAAGCAIEWAVRRLLSLRWQNPALTVAATGACLFALVGIALRVGDDGFASDRYRAEVGQAHQLVRERTEPDALLFARKGSLPLHADRERRTIRDEGALDRLHAEMATAAAEGRPVYLFCGTHEMRRLPELNALREAPHSRDWLEPIVVGPGDGLWVLFRYITPPRPADEPPAANDQTR